MDSGAGCLRYRVNPILLNVAYRSLWRPTTQFLWMHKVTPNRGGESPSNRPMRISQRFISGAVNPAMRINAVLAAVIASNRGRAGEPEDYCEPSSWGAYGDRSLRCAIADRARFASLNREFSQI
jgi:hypothetical protein